jgi:drug/metabolite transporter (DMT)-like permease
VLAIALAAGSSLVYGFSDFLGGLKSRSLPLLSVLLVSQTGALVLLLVIALGSGEGPPGGSYLAYGALAGLAEAVGVAALYRGLSIGTMSIVAPIAATAPVVPILAGAAIGELPSATQSGGILLAAAGVAIISYTAPEADTSKVVGPSVLFGLLTALGFGGFFVAMDAASEGSVTWGLLSARVVAVVAFVTAFVVLRRPLAVRRSELPVLVSIGALIVAADTLYAVASTKGLLSVVAVLSSLYPVVTIALARVYLQERVQRLQQLGIAVALCGVAVVSLFTA